MIPESVSCHLQTFESGRPLDDYGHAVIRFENGALGTISCSQVSHGRENELTIEIDGTKGGIQWAQENPNQLIVRRNGQPHALYTRDPNAPYAKTSCSTACRIPSGHPEGYLEAFGHVYRSGFDAIARREAGENVERVNTIFPNVHDGVEGMYFLQQCVASSTENGAWLTLKHPRARR